ncbi:MAG: hypothetical protein RR490_06360, partial [Niameybacter sp.]
MEEEKKQQEIVEAENTESTKNTQETKKQKDNKTKRGVRKRTPQNKKYSLKQLEEIMKEEQVLDMYIEDIDESLNMVGVVGNHIKSMIPRNEASSVVGEDGMVEERHIVNKKGKVIPVCIKEIIQPE